METKRYASFRGTSFAGWFDTLDEAIAAIDKPGCSWWHVVNTHAGLIVAAEWNSDTDDAEPAPEKPRISPQDEADQLAESDEAMAEYREALKRPAPDQAGIDRDNAEARPTPGLDEFLKDFEA